MIERLRFEREMKDVPLAEGNIGYAFPPGHNFCPQDRLPEGRAD
jgi:hypothetical protein